MPKDKSLNRLQGMVFRAIQNQDPYLFTITSDEIRLHLRQADGMSRITKTRLRTLKRQLEQGKRPICCCNTALEPDAFLKEIDDALAQAERHLRSDELNEQQAKTVKDLLRSAQIRLDCISNTIYFRSRIKPKTEFKETVEQYLATRREKLRSLKLRRDKLLPRHV